MCLYPRLIKNRKYTSNKKNNGVIPKLPMIKNTNTEDIRVMAVPVGCGKCMECLKKKSREWSVRLQEEVKIDNTGQFVTLSFSDEEYIKLFDIVTKHINLEDGNRDAGILYEIDNDIATYATRHFLELWRAYNKKSVKHWLITELGQQRTERIHIHGIIFTDKKDEIKRRWKYGNVYIGEYVNEKTVNYIVKYLSKADPIHKHYKPKILCSKGIGGNYLNKLDAYRNRYQEGKTIETYKTRQGINLGLPIYYRNGIYNEEEREKLWIEKLDKEERWVLGQKIDLKGENGEYYYSLALKYAQSLNEAKGYGNDRKNWDQIKYENERRKFELNKRKEKVKKASSIATASRQRKKS